MILSKRHKFVFIKGKKVAGTSLEVLLSSICGEEDIITPITPVDELYRFLNYQKTAQNYGADIQAHENFVLSLKGARKNGPASILIPKSSYKNHMSFLEVTKNYGEIPGSWYVFAIERSPYYKVLSLANTLSKFESYVNTGNTMISSIDDLKTSLDKIIEEGLIKRVKNIDNYKDNTGVLKTDILKYENINQDIILLMQRFGIQDYPKLPHLKKGLLSNSLSIQDICSKPQLQIINEVFREEFELFDYEIIE